jgi:polyhydroxyalkanoate synthesis regulator phasin
MTDLLRKAWFFGLGVFDFTREKVEALVQDMVQRGEISQNEGPEAVKRILAQARESQENLEEKVKAVVEQVISKMPQGGSLGLEERLVKKLEALERRVDALEKEIRDFMEMARPQY